MTSQILTVTVHNPRVEQVHRLTGDPDGRLMVTLGNGEYHGHVTLLVSDADWNSIGMAVSAFLDREGQEPFTCDYCFREESACSLDPCVGVRKDRGEIDV